MACTELNLSQRRTRLLERLAQGLWVWQTRMRERRQLAELSDVALRDVGLSRADITGEADKPFWR